MHRSRLSQHKGQGPGHYQSTVHGVGQLVYLLEQLWSDYLRGHSPLWQSRGLRLALSLHFLWRGRKEERKWTTSSPQGEAV